MSAFLAYWIHDLSPYLITFQEGFPLPGIRWYSLAYIAGFAIALWLMHLYQKAGRSDLDSNRQADLLYALVIGTLVGGRLGFMVFYRWDEFVSNPLALFAIHKGGMASHGGIIGIVMGLMAFVYLENRRRADLPALSFWKLGDLVCTLGPPGIFLGRVANFINGELWGKVTDVPWAVVFPASAEDIQADGPLVFLENGLVANPRHPSQLYAAAFEGVLLTAYLQWRFWKSRSVRLYPGQLAGEFMIGYALMRVLSEVFREPDASLILGVSRGTFYSLFMILIGAGMILRARAFKRPPASAKD